jgi:hypothetical protein
VKKRDVNLIYSACALPKRQHRNNWPVLIGNETLYQLSIPCGTRRPDSSIWQHWRNVHEGTGGLKLFSWHGRTRTFSVDLLNPVHGSCSPGLGRRMNSGRTTGDLLAIEIGLVSVLQQNGILLQSALRKVLFRQLPRKLRERSTREKRLDFSRSLLRSKDFWLQNSAIPRHTLQKLSGRTT